MVKASAPPSAEVKARAPTRKQTTALEAPLGRDPDILSLVLVLVVGLSSVRDSPPSVRQQVLQPSRPAVTPAPKVFSFQNFFFLAHFLGAFSEIIELEMSNFSRSIDDAQDASGRERRERWGERAGLPAHAGCTRRRRESGFGRGRRYVLNPRSFADDDQRQDNNGGVVVSLASVALATSRLSDGLRSVLSPPRSHQIPPASGWRCPMRAAGT